MLTPGPVQSTYIRYLLPAENGMLASSVNWAADTKICETVAGIGFGLAVSQGSADRGAILGGTAFVGITRKDITLPNVSTPGPDIYQRYDNMGVLTMGDLWVVAEGAVVAGEAVYYNTTTGALGHSGGTKIEDARWMTSAAGGALAVVRLGNIAGNQ